MWCWFIEHTKHFHIHKTLYIYRERERERDSIVFKINRSLLKTVNSNSHCLRSSIRSSGLQDTFLPWGVQGIAKIWTTVVCHSALKECGHIPAGLGPAVCLHLPWHLICTHIYGIYINTQPLGTQVTTTIPFLASVKLKVGPYLAIV